MFSKSLDSHKTIMTRKAKFDFVFRVSKMSFLNPPWPQPSLQFDTIELYTEDGASVKISKTLLFIALGPKFSAKTVTEIQTTGTRIPRLKLLHANRDVLHLVVSFLNQSDPKQNLKLEPLTVWKLFNFAAHYQVDCLTEQCFAYLQDNLTLLNCMEVWMAIQVYKSNPETSKKVSGKVQHFLVRNWTQVSQRNTDLNLLDLETLKTILVADHLEVASPEQQVWESITSWIDHDYENRILHLRSLLDVLRFGRIDLDYLLNTVLKSRHVKSSSDTITIVKAMIGGWVSAENDEQDKDGYGLLLDRNLFPLRPRNPSSVILIYGGWHDELTICNSIEAFDYQTNLWIPDLQPATLPPRAYSGLVQLEPDSPQLYIVGGSDSETGMTATLFKLDLEKREWTELASMSTKRMFHCVVALNGCIYALGGLTPVERVSTCERYDPKLDQWSPIGSMNLVRSDASAVTYRNKIYIAGGVNLLATENSVEVYDPKTDKWTFLKATMPVPRSSFSLVIYRSRMYALGGYDGGQTRMTRVDCYDFIKETWTEVASMNEPRSTFNATIFRDKIYVMNGYGIEANCTAEAYDGTSNTLAQIASTNMARTAFGTISLNVLSNMEQYSFNGNK